MKTSMEVTKTLLINLMDASMLINQIKISTQLTLYIYKAWLFIYKINKYIWDKNI